MRAWFDAAAGQARAVHPRARGLGAERGDQRRRALGGLRRRSGHPGADPHLHVDRSSGAAGRRRSGDRHVRRLRRDTGDAQQPDRRDGPARLSGLGLDLARSACRSSTFRAARSSRTTSPRPCCASSCTSPASARRPRSTSRAGRSGSSAAPRTRAAIAPVSPSTGKFSESHGDGAMPGQAGMQGSRGEVQRAEPRLDQRHRRLPERRRDLHGVHDARHSRTSTCPSWSLMPRAGSTRLRPASATAPCSATFVNAGSAAPTTSSPPGGAPRAAWKPATPRRR